MPTYTSDTAEKLRAKLDRMRVFSEANNEHALPLIDGYLGLLDRQAEAAHLLELLEGAE